MEEAKPAGTGDVEVGSGDSLVSIAVAAGHIPDTIWNDPANADLKTARGDGELLLPGDKLTVMPKRAGNAACATGRVYVFRRKAVPVTLTLIVEDEEGQPFASKKFELVLDGETQSGTTGADGKIECKVTATTSAGTLQVWLDEPGLPSPWTQTIAIGSLQPKNSIAGIQQRLANLGYYAADQPSGALDDETSAALTAFATSQQLEFNSTLDDALVGKLVEAHRV